MSTVVSGHMYGQRFAVQHREPGRSREGGVQERQTVWEVARTPPNYSQRRPGSPNGHRCHYRSHTPPVMRQQGWEAD